MGKLLEYLKSAVKQILGNGYRTFMTMLGIIIGIAAVIAVIALGNGMTDYITTQFDSIMTASGYISLNDKKTSERINADDLKEIKMTLTDIKGVSPTLYNFNDSKIKTGKGTFLADITGRSEGGLYASGSEMAEGSYFNEQHVANNARVMVILDTDAKKIFGTTNCIGMTVELSVGAKSAEYRVVGTRKNNGSLLDMLADPDTEYYCNAEIPYTTFGEDFGVKANELTSVEIYADKDILDERTKEATNIISQNHGLRGSGAISGRVAGSLGDMFDSTLGLARNFLMVGGIGVMNIMLVSVTERTREIGIRKSIGARTEAIMVQFLAEAALLTLVGGILGIIVGVGIAAIICHVLTFKLRISAMSIIGAALFSVFIGVFFGLYPARKAAKMKPIDALRS